METKSDFLIRIEPKPSTTALRLENLESINFRLDTRKAAIAVVDQFMVEEVQILIDDVEGQIKSAVEYMKNDHIQQRNKK